MAICNFYFFLIGMLTVDKFDIGANSIITMASGPPPFLIAINMFVPICGNNCVTIHVFLFTDVLLFVDVNKLYDTITNFYVTCFFMFYYNVCVLFVCMFFFVYFVTGPAIFLLYVFLGLFLLKFLLFRVHKINKSQFSLNILFF